MNLELNGARALVFGAAKGIGRAIARAFSAEGSQVVGFDAATDPEPIAAPGDIITGDVTDLNAVQAVAAPFESIDHVVYCVGVGSGKSGFPFWNLEPRDWDRVLDVNLIGAVNIAHACAPKLIARPA